MSNTDDLIEQKSIDPESELPLQPLAAKPLHRQFSAKLIALLLTVIVALALIFILFYQQSERSRLLIDVELTPLKQQLEQRQALHQAEDLVDELLFIDSGINFVERQTELIALNKQLLRLESSHAELYQQWLNANNSASDIVMRIQQSQGRNEQLKQSSIIQLQLMWFSVTPIINKKIAQQTVLFQQLQADHVKDKLTSSRSNAYVNANRQLQDLQQLKSLLAEVLSSFEQLTIHTSMEDFNLLRLSVEQIFAQRNAFKINDKTKAMADFNQQIDTFEEIVLTQQRALAKWQGSIRLAQSYQLVLTRQKNQLRKILAEPPEKITAQASSMLNYWLDKIKVKLKINFTQEELSIALLLAISLSLLVFCFLLWRLREQIKLTAQHSAVLIHKSIHAENSDDIQANCAETQEIILQVQSIAKPVHNEQEFKQLLLQCQAHQQVIDEQAQALVDITQNTEQQQLDNSEQVEFHLKGELQRYKHLAGDILSVLQQQQATLVSKTDLKRPSNDKPNIDRASKNKTCKALPFASLFPVYEQLKQFYLASNIRSQSAVLTLGDVNLVNEIHAILLNKQAEQQKFNNQLYFSYDEQLLVKAKLDFRLFQQLMYLLIDIALQDYKDAQLHLHLQLRDKSAGQQLVHFVVKVKAKAIEALPDTVTQLLDSQTAVSQGSPLVDIFTVLLVKQHGDNVVAQLIDGGFQLSFELPMAIASSPFVREQQESKLNNIKVMLLSNNAMLTGLIKKLIQSAAGQFEVLGCLDSFEQQLTAKHLNKHKLDLLIVASDFAQTHIDLINKQINDLPAHVQPKLMILQSTALSFERFGFYLQSEQLLCKDTFLQNIKALLMSEARTNQLLSPEQCQQSNYLASGLPVVLAVHSPQQYQNFQRLLHWLGLQVHVVSHADAQRELWKTGLYCILFTEFVETSLSKMKMVNKPLVDVAVFSLTDQVPTSENDRDFDGWHIGQLAEQSTLEELSEVLSPWLQHDKSSNRPESSALTVPKAIIEHIDEDEDEDDSVITELVISLTEGNFNGDVKGHVKESAKEGIEAVFDFSQYLQHQGSVELALFMLADYAQDNHQQLDMLVDAIKASDFDKAKEAIIDLQINAKILAASVLEQLCSQWLKLLSGDDIPSSLKDVNILLKETRTALTAIDSYAESI